MKLKVKRDSWLTVLCSLLELNQSISCYEQGAIDQMAKRAFAIRKQRIEIRVPGFEPGQSR